jgi:hypothetical protein
MSGKDKAPEIYIRYKDGNSVGKRTISPYFSNKFLPSSVESINHDQNEHMEIFLDLTDKLF